LEIAELTAVQQRLQKILNAAGGRIEAFFFCPHAPEEHCDCRKPAPGLLLQIAARCGVAPQELWVVGLCQAHIQAGLAVGAKVALVMPDPSLHIDCTLCAESPLPRYANWMALAHALAPD
jgi:D-glycero-D-manno-heptose 1,7-bisphosphate phosphatase